MTAKSAGTKCKSGKMFCHLVNNKESVARDSSTTTQSLLFSMNVLLQYLSMLKKLSTVLNTNVVSHPSQSPNVLHSKNFTPPSFNSVMLMAMTDGPSEKSTTNK